jgi:uncharacterized membrane protein
VTYYEFLLLGHIFAAVIWLGAGFLLTLLVLGSERAGDRLRTAGYQRDIGWLAPRLFIPSSFATLVFGVLLVADGFWTVDQLWIVIGLVGWAISFVMGLFYFKPMGAKIAAVVEAQGPESAEASELMRRLDFADHVQLTILFLVLADMVLKPTGDDTGVLIGGAVILAAVIALAWTARSRGAHGTAAA